MSLGSETQDSETGPFVFSNAGAASVTSFREEEEPPTTRGRERQTSLSGRCGVLAHVDDESDVRVFDVDACGERRWQ